MKIVKKKKEKSILIIGLGRLGKHLAKNLMELGNAVMAVDADEKSVLKVSSFLDNVIVGDCTDESVLRSIGVSNFDICFVTIGANFESSLIITSLLKKLGAKYIVTKAARTIQTDILKKIGADEIIYPEKELAEKLAVKYTASNILDFIMLSTDYAIYEIATPLSWVGKSISSMDVRRKFKINILAIRNDKAVFDMPSPDQILKEEDHLVISGNISDIEKLSL